MEERAWSAFVDAHSRLIMHVARSFGREYDAVMDRYTFVLEQLRRDDFRRLRAFAADGRGKFTTWLMVVTRRLCLDHQRERYGRVRPSPNLPADRGEAQRARRRLTDLVADELDVSRTGDPSGGNPEIDMRRQELSAALATALEALPPRDRLVLAMRFEDGRPAREIAEASPIRLRRLRALNINMPAQRHAKGPFHQDMEAISTLSWGSAMSKHVVSRGSRILALIVPAALVFGFGLACTDAPTGSEATDVTPNFHHRPGHGGGGDPGGTEPILQVTLPAMVDDATPNSLIHDGDPLYLHDECGVFATWQGTFADDPADPDGMTTRLRFHPGDGGPARGKAKKQCSEFRSASMTFTSIRVHVGNNVLLHGSDSLLVPDSDWSGGLSNMRVANVQETVTDSLGRATVNAMCAQGLRFYPAGFAGSTKLFIEKETGVRKWFIRTQVDDNDNRGFCQIANGDTLLLHVDLALFV